MSKLSHTESLINHVFWFKQEFEVKPEKEHIGSSIQWTDITDRKHDFLKELVNTVVSWVYNREKCKEIVEQRLKTSGVDTGNAYSFLTTQAFSKFRPGHPQGQFGELLLFNFIQFFFAAAPLLRKQRITTSVGHERFGADAVHYKREEHRNLIYLGESKCYKSDYSFKKAFESSLNSLEETVKKFNSELDLYICDDFIELELEQVALAYKANSLDNVNFEMVCLVAYNENRKITGSTEAEIKESIKNIIQDRCTTIEADTFNKIHPRILSRINYIIFPIWKLDELLDDFEKRVGI